MSVLPRRIARPSANVNLLYPALAFLLSLFAVAPLAYPGFWQSYSGYRAVYNLIDLHTHLDRLYPWSAVWGSAYDFFRNDGPLGYWLAELAHLVGISYRDSIKLVYALAFLVSAYAMFALARRVHASDAAALLAAALYVYFPAHIAAVYIRGAFGESVAWALFPLALMSLRGVNALRLHSGQALAGNMRNRGNPAKASTPTLVASSPDAKKPSRLRTLLPTVLAFAALTLAQPGLAILFAILALAFVIFFRTLSVRAATPLERSQHRSPSPIQLSESDVARSAAQSNGVAREKSLFLPLAAILVGVALGILIQVPSMLAQSSIVAPNGFVSAFVEPFQWLSASWGADIPRSSFMENAPYQIGIAALGLTILSVAFAMRAHQRGDNENLTRRLLWFTFGGSAVCLILMLPLLAPLWSISGLAVLVQYPFQLLALVGVLLPLAAASFVATDARFQELPLVAALVLIPLLAVYPYLSPEFTALGPTKPALARFNNGELALLDAKIVRPPGVWRHGATVQLDLTWQALRQPNRDYTVFLHVLDENGNTWGESDEKPQGGALSTLNWTAGRVYSDTHSVQIDLKGPPEGYHIQLGIYPTATGDPALTETGATEIRIDEEGSR